MTEVTKVSSKGQVVIPREIRKTLGLKEGSRLAVDNLNNVIIMKKVDIEDLKREFKKLTKRGEKFAKEKGILNEEDVVKIIHNGRGIKSNKSSS